MYRSIEPPLACLKISQPFNKKNPGVFSIRPVLLGTFKRKSTGSPCARCCAVLCWRGCGHIPTEIVFGMIPLLRQRRHETILGSVIIVVAATEATDITNNVHEGHVASRKSPPSKQILGKNGSSFAVGINRDIPRHLGGPKGNRHSRIKLRTVRKG